MDSNRTSVLENIKSSRSFPSSCLISADTSVKTNMILILLTLIVGLIVGAVVLFFRKSFGHWKKHGFPHTKPIFPWGDIKGMISTRSISETITQVYLKHTDKPFVGFWMFSKPSLMIRDPDLIKNVLVRDFMTFNDRGIYVNEKDDALSAHLVSISGKKWKNLRVKLTPTFTSGKMKMMFPILNECNKQFVQVMNGPAERREVVEIKDYASRFTTDIISLAAFGLDTDSLHNPNADFRTFGRRIFETNFFESLKMAIQFFFPNIAGFLSMLVTKPEVSEFFLRAFRESMEYRETNKIRRNDFMDLLIQLKTKGRLEDVEDQELEAGKLTFEEAAAQAFVFFAAGFETSSTTMQFALYELAKNPDVQQKVRDEIEQVLRKHNGEVTYDSVSEMSYLGRVMDETLRMYPPLPFLQRVSNKDYKIAGTDLVLPEGTQVIIDCVGLHHDPQYFPNPEKFDPDRFTEEEKAKINHYAYLPFGVGPRNCIGSRFGRMQTRMGIMALIKNFKFSVAKETRIPLILDRKSFILSPEGGMHLKIEKV